MRKFYIIYLVVFMLAAEYCLSAEAGMPQLNTEFWVSQIIWLIFIFFTLFFVIWKLFLPKIINNIENRKATIMDDLNQAENTKIEAEKKLLEYEKIILTSKNKAKKLILENKKKLEIDIKNKKEIFEKEIEKELLGVELQIKNLKKNSLININKIAIETSKEVIKQIVGTEVNTSNATAIVENVSKKNVEKYL